MCYRRRDCGFGDVGEVPDKLFASAISMEVSVGDTNMQGQLEIKEEVVAVEEH